MDHNKDKVIKQINILVQAWKDGKLGGEKMPEDENPNLPMGSELNYNYFTLPMALNYQRNSYKLWQEANKAFKDKETKDIYYPKEVNKMSEEELRILLTKYKVALQPNKQTQIWKRICNTICELLDGDIRNLFRINNFDVKEILEYVRVKNKKHFPYLSGEKICNYWLYVISNYTDAKLINKEYLNIAPDTHVLQASVKLGIISKEEAKQSNIRQIASLRWKEILKDTTFKPIDIHTPLWLWSRNGFIEV